MTKRKCFGGEKKKNNKPYAYVNFKISYTQIYLSHFCIRNEIPSSALLMNSSSFLGKQEYNLEDNGNFSS